MSKSLEARSFTWILSGATGQRAFAKRDMVIPGLVWLSGLLIAAEVAFKGMCMKPFFPLYFISEKERESRKAQRWRKW